MSLLHSLAINSEGFAFNPMSGECFSLNSTAEFVIRQMRKEQCDTDIAEQLAAKNGISKERAYTDILELQVQLRQCGLLA